MNDQSEREAFDEWAAGRVESGRVGWLGGHPYLFSPGMKDGMGLDWAWAAWQARAAAGSDEGAVAWLHDVVQGDDNEPDQALSFSPDSFPLMGDAPHLFRSVGCVPLYKSPSAALEACEQHVKILQAQIQSFAPQPAAAKADMRQFMRTLERYASVVANPNGGFGAVECEELMELYRKALARPEEVRAAGSDEGAERPPMPEDCMDTKELMARLLAYKRGLDTADPLRAEARAVAAELRGVGRIGMSRWECFTLADRLDAAAGGAK
jgi:hypothetical protein